MPRWEIPDDWSEEEDGYTTVLFCIPNSLKWRGLITAHINELTYGRYWNEQSGDLLVLLDKAREVFSTMTICNLQVELDRIATATESLAANQIKLFTLAELEAVFDENPLIDWEQLSAFFNVLGLMPGIKFDPIALVFQFLWKAQMLANSVTQSSAQTAIAATLVKGLGVDGIGTIIEGLGEGQDLISDIIDGTIGTLGALTAFAALFKDGAGGDELKVINDIVIELGDQTIVIEQNAACGTCGQSNCSCNPEIDGPLAEEAAIGLTDCCQPVGFSTFEEYQDYACVVSNWIADKFLTAMRQMELMHNRFFYDLANITEQSRLSATQVYQKVAVALPELLDPQILFTIPNDARSEIITNLTNRYLSMQDTVITEVPETSTLQEVIDEYYTDDFGKAVTELLITLGTDKQTYYDQQQPASLLADIIASVTNGIDQATGWSPVALQELFDAIMQQGVANFKFINNKVIAAYEGSFDCVGDLCECDRLTFEYGSDLGGNVYESPVSPTRLVMWAYNEDMISGNECGPQLIASSPIMSVGFVPAVSDPFIVLNHAGADVYRGDVPWPDNTSGGYFFISGQTSQFTATFTLEEDC